MTDKERLEEIRGYREFSIERGLVFSLPEEPSDWLIEQVQELQESYKRVVRNEFALKKKIIRLREALEFYADEMKYEYEITQDEQREVECEIMDDFGELARKTLEGLK